MNTYWLTFSANIQLLFCACAALLFLFLPPEKRKSLRLIGLFLWLNTICDTLGFVGGYVFRMNMNVVANIASIVDGPLLLAFYLDKIRSRPFSRFAWVMIVVLGFAGIVNFIFFQGISSPNSYTRVLGSLTIVLATLAYFNHLIKDPPRVSLTKVPMFWINALLLMYFAGVFTATLATDYVINVLDEKDYKTWIATWTIHNFIGAATYFGLAWILFLVRRSVQYF